MQLLAFARNEFALGNAAIMVNEGLPLHIIGDLRRELRSRQDDRRPARHGVQGGERRSARLAELQVQEGAGQPRAHGADHRSAASPTILSLLPLDEVIARSDLLILCTPHRCYKDADLKGKPVVDVWGLLENANVVY